jgi:hypothetical protein
MKNAVEMGSCAMNLVKSVRNRCGTEIAQNFFNISVTFRRLPSF